MPGLAPRPAPARSSKAKILGAGVAGLAGVLAVAPLAHAAPSDAPGNSSTADAGNTAKTTAPTTGKRVVADFGYKKLRIGVQQKDGSYVPPTASTVGTEITITQSGGSSTTTTPSVTTCKTAAKSATAGDDSTASFCVFTDNALQARLARTARQAKVVRGPVTGNPPIAQAYYVEPGATVTIEQTGTNAGYVTDPASPVTVAPCEVESGSLPFCGSEQIVLEDGGLPPLAKDDSAKTDEDTAVGIAIAKNDETQGAPVLGVTATTADHGTVRLIAPESADPDPSTSASSSTPAPETSTPTLLPAVAAGSRSLAAVTSYRAVYTPAAGFTGVDHFEYTIRTANGTSTATVTVTVVGVPASSSAGTSDSASVSASESSRAALADTGTQSSDLIGYAAVLLAAGGGALAIGRQRRRGRHAR